MCRVTSIIKKSPIPSADDRWLWGDNFFKISKVWRSQGLIHSGRHILTQRHAFNHTIFSSTIRTSDNLLVKPLPQVPQVLTPLSIPKQFPTMSRSVQKLVLPAHHPWLEPATPLPHWHQRTQEHSQRRNCISEVLLVSSIPLRTSTPISNAMVHDVPRWSEVEPSCLHVKSDPSRDGVFPEWFSLDEFQW